MKRVLILSLFLLSTGCKTVFPTISTPDQTEFNRLVASEPLRRSLVEGKIEIGMPYIIVPQIFQEWKGSMIDAQRAVASIGSIQRMKSTEGWNRRFADPSVKIYLDEIKVPEGMLRIWYQFPDFYRMDVSMGDTLCVFWKGAIEARIVAYLTRRNQLKTDDTFPLIPSDTTAYAEIRYAEKDKRNVSYWYQLKVIGNAVMISSDLDEAQYPIEQVELNGKKIDSYQWKR